MTATDEIRQLLDERGVGYRLNEHTKVFEWHFDGTDGEGSAHATEVKGGINIIACSLTPEQAVEATLGRGTCKVVSKPCDMWECECGKAWWQSGAPNYCPSCGRRVES